MQRTKRLLHTCEYCGNTFQARKGARFCSNSCRVLASKARNEQKSVGATPKETATKAQNVPAQRTFAPAAVNYAPAMNITPEQAKAELREFLVKAGLFVTLSYIFENAGKPKRRRK